MRRFLCFILFLGFAGTLRAQFYNETPLFQFQVFYYSSDLEMTPGNIQGEVHGNANIDLTPEGPMTFESQVTATGSIFVSPPLDLPVYALPPATNVLPYILFCDPKMTNGHNSLRLPLPGEGIASQASWDLFYNIVDMIIVVSNDSQISVASGAIINGQSTIIPSNQWQLFLNTNGSFWDARDQLTVSPVVIDVSNLVQWSATNNVIRPVLASARGSSEADIQSIYVADLRSVSNVTVIATVSTTTNLTTNLNATTSAALPPDYIIDGQPTLSYVFPASPPYVFATNFTTNIITRRVSIASYIYNFINEVVATNTTFVTNAVLACQPGLVLSNGAVLPPSGLSVATPEPAYIVGNWNVQSSFGGPSDAGESTTSTSRPSGIYADAVTILSSAWNPANSTLGLSSRIAVNDTVNAAIYAGNVPTVSNVDNYIYSGGLENFVRYLENWNEATHTFNGSMCCMFASQIANAPYPGTGSVYNPPIRKWGYDTNLDDDDKLPPLTPFLRQVVPDAPALFATRTNGAVSLAWSAHPLANYRVDYTTNLSSDRWQTLQSFVPASNSVVLIDAVTNQQRFYRLNVSP
jgi:hypothetical protein